MPGAKTGLLDYISINHFAKAKKHLSYNEHFVLATISKFVIPSNTLLKINHYCYINYIAFYRQIHPIHNRSSHLKRKHAFQNADNYN